MWDQVINRMFTDRYLVAEVVHVTLQVYTIPGFCSINLFTNMSTYCSISH